MTDRPHKLTRTNLIPAHRQALIEPVLEDDRQWFQANRIATERIRPYVEGELWPFCPAVGVDLADVVTRVRLDTSTVVMMRELRNRQREIGLLRDSTFYPLSIPDGTLAVYDPVDQDEFDRIMQIIQSMVGMEAE